jgi:hypothetical protein
MAFACLKFSFRREDLLANKPINSADLAWSNAEELVKYATKIGTKCNEKTASWFWPEKLVRFRCSTSQTPLTVLSACFRERL